MFGAGGGTSSYREIEETDVILLWGSNARETHPIFFHHLLKGVHNGARLFVVDPRRTSLGAVGRPLARARRRHRHRARRTRWRARSSTPASRNHALRRARDGGLRRSTPRRVEPFTLAEGERLTGVPADVIRETAHAFARADRAMICWTLGITEHHNARRQRALADQPRAALRPRRPLRLGPQPAARPEQRAGRRRHGRDPEQAARASRTSSATHEARARFEAAWGCDDPRRSYGWHLTQMFQAHGARRAAHALRDRREPGAVRGRHQRTRASCSRALDFLVVQDIVLTKTAEMADVVLPSSRLVVRGARAR